MYRKQFLSTLVVLLAVMVVGCGSGSSSKKDESPSITNPSGSTTDLSGLTLQPYQNQAAKISYATSFLLSWSSASVAPNSAQLDIVRFLEGRGGESRSEIRQAIDLNQRSASSWAIKKQGDLDAGGVYFVDVRTAIDRRRYAYVVEGGRATVLPNASAATRGQDITNSGGTGSLSNLNLLWAGKSSGSVNISTGTDFILQFPSESAAPTNFSVRLRRYKEARGSDKFSENEQPIEVSHTGGQNTWTVKRRDNFRLESGATYILEVTTDGDPVPQRFVFITEG